MIRTESQYYVYISHEQCILTVYKNLIESLKLECLWFGIKIYFFKRLKSYGLDKNKTSKMWFMCCDFEFWTWNIEPVRGNKTSGGHVMKYDAIWKKSLFGVGQLASLNVIWLSDDNIIF